MGVTKVSCLCLPIFSINSETQASLSKPQRLRSCNEVWWLKGGGGVLLFFFLFFFFFVSP
jgi:hypothetical protein